MTSSSIVSSLGSKIAPAVAMLCAFIALCIYLFFFELVFSAKLFLFASLAFGVIWAVSRRASIGRALRRLFGAGAFSFAIEAISAVVILAVLLGISVNHKAAWDWTVNDSFTLSSSSMKLVKNLAQPVQIIGFLRSDDPRRTRARDLFAQYEQASDLIQTRIIDPDRNPAEAMRYGGDVYGRAVVRCAKREEWSSSWTEQSLSGIIARASSDYRQKVYFVTGHGEREIDTRVERSLSQAALDLTLENYDIARFEFPSQLPFPTDASVVILPAPRVDYLPDAVASLKSYLSSGGRILMLLEPGGAVPLSGTLSALGLDILPAQVIDPASHVFGDPNVPAISRAGQLASPIASGLPGVFFPGARAIRPSNSRPIEADSKGILLSSASSYAVRQGAPSGSEPIMGPFFLAASVESPVSLLERLWDDSGENQDALKAKQNRLMHPNLAEQLRRAGKLGHGRYARIVVISDADFASNRFIDQLGNQQLFLAAVKWLSERDDIALIPRAANRESKLLLTSLELNVVKFVSIVLFPLLAAAVGAAVWWRRR